MPEYTPEISSLKEIEEIVKDSQSKWGMREILEANIGTLFANSIIKVISNSRNPNPITFDPSMTGLAILHGSMSIMNTLIHNDEKKIKSVPEFKEELIAIIMDVQQLGYHVRCNYSEMSMKGPNGENLENAFFDLCVGGIDPATTPQDTSTGINASRLLPVDKTDHDGILELLNSYSVKINKEYEEYVKQRKAEKDKEKNKSE